jgi:ATP-binding cassette subfamily B protein/subfamily B ATP-binding cassette protein MsbA
VKYFSRALQYLRPYKALAFVSVLLVIISVFIGLLGPWPLKYIIDNVLKNEPWPEWASFFPAWAGGNFSLMLGVLAATGLFLAVLHNLLSVLDNYVNTKIDQGMTLDVRSQLFQHVQSLSLATHDQRRSGMLIYAINSMADSVPRLIMAIPPLAQSALTLLGMFCYTLHKDWQLALTAVAVAPFLYYSVGYYMRKIQPRLYEVRGLEAESLAIVHEAISMIRVTVAFGREFHEYQRFRVQGERAIDARVKLTVRQTLFTLCVNSITALGTAGIVWLGASAVLNGRMTIGDLTIVLAYIAAVYKPLETISTTIGSLQSVFVSIDLIFSLLDQVPEIKDGPDAVTMERASGHVTYKAVDFNYKGRVDTLKDIAFEANPGEVIAIVGPTGAGKTTLVSLLPRLYDAQHGQILLDHQDIRKLTLKSLREQISIVLQEPLLFSGSIAENIRYGRLDARREEIIEAAKAANAHDFIMKLPQQYDTELGERGAKLSGGERQRIAVARAFIKDAPILILDEPTSSIDSKTEAVILDALDRLMVGRTTFMIAHRLSTIRRADKILVMDQGRIVEHGTHEQLLAQDGLYKQLYDMQNKLVRSRRKG